jgi:hypothetical protein
VEEDGAADLGRAKLLTGVTWQDQGALLIDTAFLSAITDHLLFS